MTHYDDGNFSMCRMKWRFCSCAFEVRFALSYFSRYVVINTIKKYNEFQSIIICLFFDYHDCRPGEPNSPCACWSFLLSRRSPFPCSLDSALL